MTYTQHTEFWNDNAWEHCGDGPAEGFLPMTVDDAQDVWDAYIRDWVEGNGGSGRLYRLVTVDDGGEVVDSVEIEIDDEGDAFARPEYARAAWLEGQAELPAEEEEDEEEED